MSGDVALDKRVKQALEALQQGQPSRTRQICHRLLEKNPKDFNALQLQAMALRREGKHEAAANYFGRAAQAAPNADLRQSMRVQQARCEDRVGRQDEALRLLDRVLEENIAHAEALYSKALILRYRGEERAALECFKQVVFYPPAVTGVDELERAGAHWHILTSPKLEPQDEDIDQARQDLQWIQGGDARAQLLFAIYSGEERRGRYSSAWRDLKAANRQVWRQVAFPLRTLQSAGEAVLTEIELNPPGKALVDNKLPLAFICGLPRSGTTLVESVLLEHPGVATLGESVAVSQVFNRVYPEQSVLESDGRYDPRRLQQFARQLDKRLFAGREDARALLLEKTPNNFYAINQLLHVFANSRFVVTVKSPREACFSLFRQNFEFKEQIAYSYNLAATVLQYRVQERIVNELAARYPDRVRWLRYEDMIREGERLWPEIFDFLGLEWNPDFLEFHGSGRTVRTISAAQVREGISAKYLSRTDRYGPVLRELDALLEYSIEELALL